MIMDKLMRRYTFRLYPKRIQLERLERIRALCSRLYNALLEERFSQWALECQTNGKGERKGLPLFGQKGSSQGLTQVRADDPEYAALPSSVMEGVHERMSEAVKAFMRRAKAGAGARSGPPRYRRLEGFQFTKPSGCGWRLDLGDPKPGDDRPRHGRLYIKSVPGLIRVRGRLPCPPNAIKTCSMRLRDGVWSLSVVIEMPVRRAAGEGIGEVAFDLVSHFARVSRVDGGCAAGLEDGFSPDEGQIGPIISTGSATSGAAPPEMGARIEAIQREMADARAKQSWGRYRRLKRRKAKLQAAEARRRLYALHHWSTGVQRAFHDLNVIAPASIAEITKSGAGTKREPGAEVAFKAFFNRAVLDLAPAEAIAQLDYKITEAGGTFIRREPEQPVAALGNALVQAAKSVKRLKRAKPARHQPKGTPQDVRPEA